MGARQGVVTAARCSRSRHSRGAATRRPSRASARSAWCSVVSFCRIDDHAIRVREPVMEPDALIVQDPTLLNQVDVFGGLKRDGFILINSSKSLTNSARDFVEDLRHERLLTVPAGDLARERTGRPVRMPRCWAVSRRSAG